MRHFEIDTVLQRLAERRIEEAMRQGKFDNLPGRGQPCDLEPMPVDENARMIWWALRLMKNAGQTPDEVRLRRQVESLKDELSQATSEARVRALVGAINSIAKQVNAIASGHGGSMQMGMADLGRELGRLHHRARTKAGTAGTAATLAVCANHLCASANPGAARFCRRCGAPLAVC
jgi:hypothetical protein